MLKGVCVGAGYFAQFHYEAWSRIPEVEIVAACDLDDEKVSGVCKHFNIPRFYSDVERMLDKEKPDFIDIITPPQTHLAMVKAAAERGITVVCQKPLAPTYVEAQQIVETAEAAGIRFMVHENFRFQPWHREIKKLIDGGAIGDTLFSLNFRSRQGDGWGRDAYLGRQPYFRSMPRLLLHETGIHFIDTFQYHAGEINRVYAIMRKLNPVIAGEDFAMLTFEFRNGVVGLWDANRYNEPNTENPRYTFGRYCIEGNGGTLRLYNDGRLTVQELGEPEADHVYKHQNKNFSGDCVFATQTFFVDALLNNKPFETDGTVYLNNMRIEEAFYASMKKGQPVELDTFTPSGTDDHAVV